MRFFEERWRSTDVSGYSVATQFDGIKWFVCLPEIFFVYHETPEFADPGLVVQHLLKKGYLNSPGGDSPRGRIVPSGWTPGMPGRIVFEEGVTSQTAIRMIRQCFGATESGPERELYGDHLVFVGTRRIGYLKHIVGVENSA